MPDANDVEPGDVPVCSGKGCRAPAVWALVWNNPKVHTPERRKVWLACDDHRAHLVTFLEARSFLRDVLTMEELRASEMTSDPSASGRSATEQASEPTSGSPVAEHPSGP
jgi:hypothetical protein